MSAGEMTYRRVGRSGLQTSVVSLGAWATIGERFGLSGTVRMLDQAYRLGVNFFDNAETYLDGRAEEVMGRALAQLKWPRETYLLSSKVYWGTGSTSPTARGLSRKHVAEACDAALRRLSVDYLDLYLCHRPDPDVPIAETVEAMSDLISHQGKVLYWGTSEWAPAEIARACEVAEERHLVAPIIEQARYNLLARSRVEEDYEPLFERLGLGLSVWSPLAYGLLTGKYNAGFPAEARLGRGGYEWLRDDILDERAEARLEAIERMRALAGEVGMSPAQLSMLWVLGNPVVSTALTGASTPDQLRETVGAVAFLGELEPQLRAEVGTLFPPELVD
ncbi:MAG TPA: aldo/keto reductase [Solirubrobacterales bacterium]|nr:aldo/keto reductase [Solirubrobacterales bacterium]